MVISQCVLYGICTSVPPFVYCFMLRAAPERSISEGEKNFSAPRETDGRCAASFLSRTTLQLLPPPLSYMIAYEYTDGFSSKTRANTCNQEWNVYYIHSRKLIVILSILCILTPARWWRWLKFSSIHIHCCTYRGYISNQLKAQITRVVCCITNKCATECHHAIDNVKRIIAQCYRCRIISALCKH